MVRSQVSHMTYAPLATEGKATVDRFLFSANVRQFLTVFSKFSTASVPGQLGLWTWITCLQGNRSPDPPIAAVLGKTNSWLKVC